MVRTILAGVLLLSTSSSFSGELSYNCVIRNVYNLANSGELKSSGFEKEMKGSSFSVSRIDGQVIGEVLPTLLAKSTRVLNKGSSEYSFSTVAEFDKSVQVLDVQEFTKGPVKPFISLSMGGAGVVTGTCK